MKIKKEQSCTPHKAIEGDPRDDRLVSLQTVREVQMKQLILLASAALLVAGTSIAFSAGETKFAQEDSNHDGQMTWEEAQAGFPELTEPASA